MKRAEALEDFKIKIVQEMLTEDKVLFSNRLKLEKSILLEKGKSILVEISSKVKFFQQINNDYKVKYLQIALLRTSILSEKYTYLVSMYDENYFLDQNRNQITCDIPEWFETLTALKYKLYELKKPYMGKIQDYDIDQIILEQAILYSKELAKTYRVVLNDIEDDGFIQDIHIADKFFIKWGEHRELSENIYCKDLQSKNQNDFISFNKGNTVRKQVPIFNYQVWNQVKFEKLTCEEKNLICSSFKHSLFKDIRFIRSILYGSNFKGVKIQACHFENCNLENCHFVKAEFKCVNFHHTSLKGSNFKEAIFEEVSFTDTILEGAIFSSQAVPYLHLSSEQLQQIIIEDDENVFCNETRQ